MKPFFSKNSSELIEREVQIGHRLKSIGGEFYDSSMPAPIIP